MGYETAPATRMLAVRCCICSRPLVDADSVEAGIGPDCRAKYGYGVPAGEPLWAEAWELLAPHEESCNLSEAFAYWAMDSREAVNVLVHRLAVIQDGKAAINIAIAIRMLGYYRLADRALERMHAVVRVDEQGDWLLVRAPYSDAFNEAVRAVPGQRWDREAKARRVPVTSRRQLWNALVQAYPGTLCVGVRGSRVIG